MEEEPYGPFPLRYTVDFKILFHSGYYFRITCIFSVLEHIYATAIFIVHFPFEFFPPQKKSPYFSPRPKFPNLFFNCTLTESFKTFFSNHLLFIMLIPQISCNICLYIMAFWKAMHHCDIWNYFSAKNQFSPPWEHMIHARTDNIQNWAIFLVFVPFP